MVNFTALNNSTMGIINENEFITYKLFISNKFYYQKSLIYITEIGTDYIFKIHTYIIS